MQPCSDQIRDPNPPLRGVQAGLQPLSLSPRMASSSGSKTEFIVGEKYKLVGKIRSSSFRDIYLVINITNVEEMSMKLESQKAKHLQLL